MSDVTRISGSTLASQVDSLVGFANATQGDYTMPNAGSDNGNGGVGIGNLPTLEVPTNVSSILNLSEESIIEMLGMDERIDAVNSGISQIQEDSDRRKSENAKKIQKLQESIKKAEEQKNLSVWQKVFKCITVVLSIVGSGLGIAAAVATGNVLLGVGAALTLLNSIDSAWSIIHTIATDGKETGGGYEWLASKFTDDKELSQKIASGVSIGVSILAAVCSFTAIFKNTTSGVAEVMSKTDKYIKTANNVDQFITGGATIATGVVDMFAADVNAQQYYIKADLKKIEAILERIQNAMDFDTDVLQMALEKSQKMVESVGKLISDCADAQAALVSDSRAMA